MRAIQELNSSSSRIIDTDLDSNSNGGWPNVIYSHPDNGPTSFVYKECLDVDKFIQYLGRK